MFIFKTSIEWQPAEAHNLKSYIYNSSLYKLKTGKLLVLGTNLRTTTLIILWTYQIVLTVRLQNAIINLPEKVLRLKVHFHKTVMILWILLDINFTCSLTCSITVSRNEYIETVMISDINFDIIGINDFSSSHKTSRTSYRKVYFRGLTFT